MIEKPEYNRAILQVAMGLQVTVNSTEFIFTNI